MKTTKESLKVCKEFTFFGQYIFERVIELNQARDCVISILFKGDFMSEDKVIRVLGVLDDISLMSIDGNVEPLVQEIFNLRVAFIQTLRPENLYKEEAAKEDKDRNHDRLESFQ